jgi:tetratricopeptide (TPR) repeat protein
MTQMTIQQAIELGWQHQQQGRFAEAEAVYRQVLASYPNHPDAMQLLGVLAAQVGKADIAMDLIRRAIAINPRQPMYHCNLGQAYLSVGRADDAVAAFAQAITLKPDFFQAIVNQGNAYLARRDFDQAISNYRRAIELDPNVAETYNNLGNAFRHKQQIDHAMAAYREAIARNPRLPDAHYNLAIALKDSKRFDEAIVEFQQAISLRPNYPEAINNLGNVYQTQGRLEEAAALFRQAIALRPGFVNARNNLANVLHDERKLDDAIASYRQVMEMAPEWALPHYNYSLTLLLLGEFEQGWREHEFRRKAPEIEIFIQDFPKPSWDGSDLNGQTILIHSEQGFGDAIQFARYLPMVAARGGRVIFQCHDELADLFKGIAGAQQVVARGQPLPEFDLHLPLLSLPLIFQTNSFESIPCGVPYLQADPELSQRWRQRAAPLEGKLKVGLVWSGRVHPPGRSVELAALAPLAKVPGVSFVSLQVGEASKQADSPPPGMTIANWSDGLRNFTDTAALMEQIDLLITIDTAAAHLAGAMGKPVWVLVPWKPDWRWLLDDEQTRWYPTMRLYRQPTRGDFATPIQRMAADLNALVLSAR